MRDPYFGIKAPERAAPAAPPAPEKPPEPDATQLLREILALLLANAQATTPPPTEIHLHIDKDAFRIDATSHVDAGAVVISPGAVQVAPAQVELHPHIDAQVHVDPGAIHLAPVIQVEAPKPVDVEIVRDGVGRPAGLRVVS